MLSLLDNMDFENLDFSIFAEFLKRRPEINPENLKNDLQKYYFPFVKKLIDLKNNSKNPILVGVSAIQGAGKTTQGEVLEILLNYLKHQTLSLSIDDFYLTHEELNQLREKDPRYIRRGVTHDIPLMIKTLTDLKNGMDSKIPTYDKGLFNGDGDRSGFKTVNQKFDFIFFDGWMLGAKRVLDESIFESGLPALDSLEHIQFAKDINKKLDEYKNVWDLIDFMNVLYVENYEVSLKWRDQAEDALRQKGEGMSHDEIKQFVYYFWRSVHPAIHIKNLVSDPQTDQIVYIDDNHSIKNIKSNA